MIKAVRGFKDVLPDDMPYWRLLEEEARSLFESFGYREIRIPVLEKLELFQRGIGSTTDIVEKEMYVFEDRNGELLALRPEATAGIARAFIEHALHLKDHVHKYYFFGPMFRHERPQAGRLRQFHQLNVEAYMVKAPSMDAETIAMLYMLAKKVKIDDGVSLEINHIGCPKCRPIYRDILINFLGAQKEKLCKDCNKRLERNPLRVLDCKKESCRAVASSAPQIIDYLCDECKSYFESTLEYLSLSNVPFVINPMIVRGLDYYTGVVFELTTTELGAQNAVAAGGRYDNLVEELGGPSVPGIGFAVGVERTVALMKARYPLEWDPPVFFFAVLGEEAKRIALPVVLELRNSGIKVEMEHTSKSLKAQMRKANKLNCRFVVMIGEDEIKKKVFVVKDLVEKKQFEIEADISRLKELAEAVS
ncbi:histidine--tRNA ligase [Thermosulfidibacter takaii]|nr:histidine--tRNA ligase [Thermosulfidibacter takaii]